MKKAYRVKKVGWALAHRSDMVGQSPTLQCHNDQTKGYRRRSRLGRLPGQSLAAISTFIALFFVFVFVLLPAFVRFIDKLSSRGLQHAKQLSQFRRIDAALDLFKNDLNFYPPSGALNENDRPCCGAMKLVEAIMDQDLNNFNVRERYYLRDGNSHRLKDLYNNVAPFDGNEHVLCDEFWQDTDLSMGRRYGMPILYYKANTSKTAHDINDPNNPENIFDYRDNHALLALGVPGKPGQKHPLYEDPKIFYEMAINDRIAGPKKPYRADTYILLSAGYDGLYGTKDDIANFDMQWKPK